MECAQKARQAGKPACASARTGFRTVRWQILEPTRKASVAQLAVPRPRIAAGRRKSRPSANSALHPSPEGGRGGGKLGRCRWISLHPGSRRDKSAVRKPLPKRARE